MDGVVIAIISLNGVILMITSINAYRTGKLEGSMKNGGYLKCPFYKKRVEK